MGNVKSMNFNSMVPIGVGSVRKNLILLGLLNAKITVLKDE
ncbi:hypothetical protein Z949_1124 [Sulfitobacter guttiformis KCTC 32187]|nr:hypothetical protein Z949_1124 [Sulfitobacter guttiformis KCTC 32187]